MFVLKLLCSKIFCVSNIPVSHGDPACLIDDNGLAPVPPSCPEIVIKSAFALTTPAATMPTTSVSTHHHSCFWINGVKPRASTQSSRMFSSIAGTTSSSLMIAHRTATRPMSTARSYALAPLTAGRARTLALSTSAATRRQARTSTDTLLRSPSSAAPSAKLA